MTVLRRLLSLQPSSDALQPIRQPLDVEPVLVFPVFQGREQVEQECAKPIPLQMRGDHGVARTETAAAAAV
jgi:hypothetical protein